jgi:hypothetical protein
VKKTLSESIRCDCGYLADRDVNGARNILHKALGRSYTPIWTVNTIPGMDDAFVDECGLPRHMKREAHGFRED